MRLSSTRVGRECGPGSVGVNPDGGSRLDCPRTGEAACAQEKPPASSVGCSPQVGFLGPQVPHRSEILSGTHFILTSEP